jgi:hypothetical protein
MQMAENKLVARGSVRKQLKKQGIEIPERSVRWRSAFSVPRSTIKQILELVVQSPEKQANRKAASTGGFFLFLS